jgi:hypothetical protein
MVGNGTPTRTTVSSSNEASESTSLPFLQDFVSWRIFTPPAPLRLAARCDVILAFGDSVLEQFIASSSSSSTSRIRFGDKVALLLLTHTVPALLDALEQSLGPHLHNHDDGDDQNVALILNSALWNVLSDEATIPSSTGPAAASLSLSKDYVNDPWDNHVQALTEFLTQVLQRYGSDAPSSEASPPQRQDRVTVYWLLPTAVHIHRVHVADSDAIRWAPQKINRTRYLSASRTRQLYHRLKQVVHGRHYRPGLNQRMLSWCL